MKLLWTCLFLMTVLGHGDSFVEGFEKRFSVEKPKVGDPLPNATGYDLEQKPFLLSQLKGDFSVVVSGCFT